MTQNRDILTTRRTASMTLMTRSTATMTSVVVITSTLKMR